MREEIIGDARLILGDCREVLPTLGRFDAVLSDPPYGIDIGGSGTIGGSGVVSVRDYGVADWDKVGMSADQWSLIKDRTEKWIIWGGNHLSEVIGPSAGVLAWDKKCQNGWDDTFSEFEFAWTNVITRAKGFRHLWAGALRASEQGHNVRRHPTQKPIKLMEWCLGFLPDAETILDPFMGAGSSGVACANLGRKFTGVEISEKYFDISCERIAKAYDQPDMFISPPSKPIQELHKAIQLSLTGDKP